ncbi:DEAD-domain-containing protein [Thozetella sp. PMI_491]|nr:DEAD-domain-containing protein [Thozetella sp. PMI_491]
MSVPKKHRRDEDESQATPVSKKLKTDVVAPADGDDAAALKAEKKRRKKEKREKKEKEEKEAEEGKKEEKVSKKEKKVKKDKKDKKEKKEKKEKKKDKKSREQSVEEKSDTNPEAEGDATSAPAPKTETNGSAVNGSSNGHPTYKQSPALDALPAADIQAYLEKQQITISDSGSASQLRPILEFAHIPSSDLVSKNPFATFTTPTPIQAASWPFSLAGRDIIGIAETGSGKTFAFALPCVEALSRSAKPAPSKDRTVHARAVIVSPTRELAMQTHASISTLASLVGLSAVCLFGGSSKDEQRALLRKNRGADIVVATPGRLKDFLSEGCVSLEQVQFAVLDEADRMLDKGFEEDIKLILGQCPAREQRQTLMFTATWPTSVRGLAEGFMVNPVKITIGGKTRAGDEDEDGNGTVELQANSRITQKVEVVEARGKEFRLFQLLKEAQQGKGKNDRILVFCLYKKEAVRVEQFLERKGIRVASIHGDLRQEQRTRSLEAFKAGTTTVLVATDVAARGLDIPEVKLVINLTFPLTIEDYVHRIGRTGRAGKEGNAITLFTEHDKAHSGSLVNILKGANQEVPEDLLKFGTTVKKKAHDSYGAFFKDVDMNKKGTKITFD